MRSALFVPGDSARKQEKALESGADALFLDLEDSVALSAKDAGRKQVAEFLASAPAGGPELWVRVNALDTDMTDLDLAAAIAPNVAGIVLPKAEHGNDVTRLDTMMRVHEAKAGLTDGNIAIIAIVTETARGVVNAGTYSDANRRLQALTWGAEDLAADIGTTRQRDENGQYTSIFQHARCQCLFGAVAASVAPLDTVFPNFRDMDGLKTECLNAAADGFTGKMAIHPGQVPTINAAFTPTEEALAWAKAVVDAFAEAGENAGVLSLNGEMLDRPHLRKAQGLIARSK
jgi:citrate lyase subunit beta/citryl-CoA lyase